MKKENKLYNVHIDWLFGQSLDLGIFDEKGISIFKKHFKEYLDVVIDQAKRGIEVNENSIKKDLKTFFCETKYIEFYDLIIWSLSTIKCDSVQKIHMYGDDVFEQLCDVVIKEFKPNGFLN